MAAVAPPTRSRAFRAGCAKGIRLILGLAGLAAVLAISGPAGLSGNEPSPAPQPRLGINASYLGAWQREGGSLFCHFSSVGRWTKWGSWGLIEYYDDGPSASPIFRL